MVKKLFVVFVFVAVSVLAGACGHTSHTSSIGPTSPSGPSGADPVVLFNFYQLAGYPAHFNTVIDLGAGPLFSNFVDGPGVVAGHLTTDADTFIAIFTDLKGADDCANSFGKNCSGAIFQANSSPREFALSSPTAKLFLVLVTGQQSLSISHGSACTDNGVVCFTRNQ